MDLRTRVALPASPVGRDVLDRAETLTGLVAELLARHADWPCLVLLDRQRREQRLSLGVIATRAAAIEMALAGRGLARGGVVLLALPTSPELIAAYLAVLRAGLVPGLVATPTNRVADRRVYATRVGA